MNKISLYKSSLADAIKTVTEVSIEMKLVFHKSVFETLLKQFHEFSQICKAF